MPGESTIRAMASKPIRIWYQSFVVAKLPQSHRKGKIVEGLG